MIGPVAAAVAPNNPWKTGVWVGLAAVLSSIFTAGSTKPVRDVVGVLDVPLAVARDIKYAGEGEVERSGFVERLGQARRGEVDPAFWQPAGGRIPPRADGCQEAYMIRTGIIKTICGGTKG